MPLQTTPWDVQEFLQTPEDCALYLQAAIDEAGDDSEFIAKTLGDVARSRGMASVARASGLSREGLYKALGEGGNPTFATVLRVIRALGMQLKIEAAIEGT